MGGNERGMKVEVEVVFWCGAKTRVLLSWCCHLLHSSKMRPTSKQRSFQHGVKSWEYSGVMNVTNGLVSDFFRPVDLHQ